jgi:hypothetical protein
MFFVFMVEYPTTNIFLKDKYEFNLPHLYNELNLIGTPWHQNTDNPKRKELHYFVETCSVVVSEYDKKTNIKIIASHDLFLSDLKSKIEKILDKSRPKEII